MFDRRPRVDLGRPCRPAGRRRGPPLSQHHSRDLVLLGHVIQLVPTEVRAVIAGGRVVGQREEADLDPVHCSTFLSTSRPRHHRFQLLEIVGQGMVDESQLHTGRSGHHHLVHQRTGPLRIAERIGRPAVAQDHVEGSWRASHAGVLPRRRQHGSDVDHRTLKGTHPSPRATARRRNGPSGLRSTGGPAAGGRTDPAPCRYSGRRARRIRARATDNDERRAARASSARGPRSSNGTPRRSNSGRREPTPRPRITRPLGDLVERSVALGDLERMVITEDQDVGGESDLRGQGGQIPECGQRVPVPAPPYRGHVGGNDDVLAAGQMVIAQSVCCPGYGGDILDGAILLPSSVGTGQHGEHRRGDTESQRWPTSDPVGSGLLAFTPRGHAWSPPGGSERFAPSDPVPLAPSGAAIRLARLTPVLARLQGAGRRGYRPGSAMLSLCSTT